MYFDDAYNKLSLDEKNEVIIKEQIGPLQWDDRVTFVRDVSTASCKIDHIKSFVYGGFSSRFWLLRKHLNSLPLSEVNNMPFYCWQCITLKTDTRDIDLVIKNEKDMRYFLEFLIISLKTLDGARDSAKNYLLQRNRVKKSHTHSQFQRLKNFMYGKKEHDHC